MGPTELPPLSDLTPSLPLDLSSSLLWLDSLKLVSRRISPEPETNSSVTSVTDTLTSDGTPSMRKRSSPSVPSSSTTDVPPWPESSDLWSTRRSFLLDTMPTSPSLDTSNKHIACNEVRFGRRPYDKLILM